MRKKEKAYEASTGRTIWDWIEFRTTDQLCVKKPSG